MASDSKSDVIDKLKEAGKGYKRLIAYQKKDKTKTKNDQAREKKAFFQTYLYTMELYESIGERNKKTGETKETGFSKMIPFFGRKEVKQFIQAYYAYKNPQNAAGEQGEIQNQDPIQSVLDTVDRKSRYAQNGMEAEEEQDAEPVQGLLPATLSHAQKKGINDISRWMIRNAFSDDAAGSFVLNFIMNQPVRLKLLAYYLIEKKSRMQTDAVGVINAQNYIPDLDKFKNQMIATKWKFWKRIAGSEIYWDKLGDAMRTALSCKPMMIKLYGSEAMEQEEELHREEERQEPDGEQQGHDAHQVQAGQGEEEPGNNGAEFAVPVEEEEENEIADNTDIGNPEHAGEENQSASEENQEEGQNQEILLVLTRTRSRKLSDFLNKIQAYDTCNRDKKKKKADVENAKADVLSAFDALVQADWNLEVAQKRLEANTENTTETTGKSGPTAVEDGAWKTIGKGNAKVSQVVNVYKGTSKAIKVFKVWNLGDESALLKGKIDEVLGLATAPVKLVNLILDIAYWKKNTKDMTFAAKLSKGLDMIATTAQLGGTGITAYHNISQWIAGANFVADDAAKLSSTVSGSISVATGGAQFLAGSVKVGVGLKKSYDISKTKESLDALKNPEANDDHAEDNRMDDTEAEMVGESLEVERRNNTTANAFAAVNTIAAAANTTAGALTLTGVGAAAGVVLSVLGSSTVLVSSIAEYFINRRNRIKAIDIYMGIDKDTRVNEIGDSIARGMELDSRENISELKTSTLREKIRNTVMHKKGYMSPESFYSKVCMDYANVIYKGLFKRCGNMLQAEEDTDKFYEYSEVEKKLTEKEKLYAKMLFNVKLKPRFSKSMEKCSPAPATIATKLNP